MISGRPTVVIIYKLQRQVSYKPPEDRGFVVGFTQADVRGCVIRLFILFGFCLIVCVRIIGDVGRLDTEVLDDLQERVTADGATGLVRGLE